jgi:hypothetical protein
MFYFLFLSQVMLFSWFLFQMIHYWHKETLLIFACWYCFLCLWLTCISTLNNFWCNIWLFLYIRSSHLEIERCDFFSSLEKSDFCLLLIVLAWTSSIVLNKIVLNVSILTDDRCEKAFIFSQFTILLAVVLFWIAFIMLRHVPCVSDFFSNFYKERMLNYIKCLSCISWDDQMAFVLNSIHILHHNF